ncbi:hypothetical protein WA577_006313, partial [Blastocystis sp. JDR]
MEFLFTGLMNVVAAPFAAHVTIAAIPAGLSEDCLAQLVLTNMRMLLALPREKTRLNNQLLVAMCGECPTVSMLATVLRIAACYEKSWRENRTWRELLEGIVAKLKVRLEKNPEEMKMKEWTEMKGLMKGDYPPGVTAHLAVCSYYLHPVGDSIRLPAASAQQEERVKAALTKLRAVPRNKPTSTVETNRTREERLQMALSKLRSR